MITEFKLASAMCALLMVISAMNYSPDSYASADSSQEANPKPEASSEFTPWSGFGFPVWLALNAPPREYGIPQRTVLVLLGEKDFTESNLRLLFLRMAAEFDEPKALSITVFSNKEMLHRAVKLHKSLIVDFLDTPDGRKEG